VKQSGRRKSIKNEAEAVAGEAWSVPSEQELAQITAEMDDPSKWVELDTMRGPGFYRAPMVARQLAEFLASYRAQHGLTQRQLARSIALNERLVAYIESGQYTPDLETLVRLARHLDLSFTVRVTPAGAELSVEAPAPTPASSPL
jgi:ribosome-binding protein aMBF1 (putative translation factor)